MDIKKLQNNILSWYAKHGRKLPWRQTTDPYAIHVSEVMLQQTQVDRVIPYFHRWLKDFPNYESLAKASKSDLLKHRSGLGFNSRALRLQACAKVVVEQGGTLPKERDKLQKFPGIGPYTSAAIMAFARNYAVPVIDTNIRRVLIFLFGLDEKISPSELEQFAFSVIPHKKSRDWHNALMDYGALELTARKTKIKSLSKQSTFEGSDRQVRGWIIKYLTREQNPLPLSTIQSEFPQKDIEKIIQSMVNDGLIHIKGKKIVINEE